MASITDRIDCSRAVSGQMFRNHFGSYKQFGSATSVKLSKHTYQLEINVMHEEGKMNIIKSLLRSHIEDPYGSVDDLIGDLQLLLKHTNNNLTRLMPSHAGMSIERIIRDVEESRTKGAPIGAISVVS